MDFSLLSEADLQDFINRDWSQYEVTKDPNSDLVGQADWLFDQLKNIDGVVFPVPVIDLYLATIYEGDIDQTYTRKQIMGLTPELIQVFDDVLGFNASLSNALINRQRIYRILNYLGLIETPITSLPTGQVPGGQTITITFGPVAENQVGMQKIGTDVEEGFTPEELYDVYERATADGYEAEYYNLNDWFHSGNEEELAHLNPEPAAVVLIRNGLQWLFEGIEGDIEDGPLKLWEEQLELEPDTQYWDTRRSRVLNKRARYNLCFAEEAQFADLDNKMGTIYAFKDLPYLNYVRKALGEKIGDKAKDLNAEGNYYYDPSKCGIGYHGDSERKIVIAMRLGESMPLHYHWFYQSKPIGETAELMIHHGDLYIMSEKATGYDWKRRIIPTLRHAAGAPKYLKFGK